ncbi:MAG: hypothetical protein UH788_00770 [Treponemataceae bacterium]|nr:hypothetical protein [Treponemataceae bacterium]
MKKLSLPAILILLFLFVSCTPVEFFHSFSCSTDKDVYQTGEKICLNIKGEVSSKLYKDGTLYVNFSTSEEIIDINELVTHYENLNSRNIEFTGIESNNFIFNVSSNSYDDIDEKLFFSISNAGEYTVSFQFHADRISPTLFTYWGEGTDFCSFSIVE